MERKASTSRPMEKKSGPPTRDDATVTIIDVATKKAIQTVPIPVKGANR